MLGTGYTMLESIERLLRDCRLIEATGFAHRPKQVLEFSYGIGHVEQLDQMGTFGK